MPNQDPSDSLGLSAAELARQFGGVLIGDGGLRLEGFAALDTAGPQQAAFINSNRYADQLDGCKAGLIVVPRDFQGDTSMFPCVVQSDNPYLFFARASLAFIELYRRAKVPATEIHPTAVVSKTAQIGQRVRIGAFVTIGDGVRIGDDSDVGSHTVIANGVKVGVAGQIQSRVTIEVGTSIGDRCVIHSGVVIGSDGFGFASTPDHQWVKIPQTGGVEIGDDVEIGANTVIDCGTLKPTRVGNGVKLDNLIQIAHNVEIGDHTAIAGCVGVAGSAVIGKYCQIGGAAGILGHLRIADHTVIGPMSLVISSIETPGKYVGFFPLQAEADWERSAAIVRRLPSMRSEIKAVRSELRSNPHNQKD